jgi:hypothetical protein
MLMLALAFVAACVVLIVGTMVFLLLHPKPDGWLRRPRWRDWGVVHLVGAILVPIGLAGWFPVLLLSAGEGPLGGIDPVMFILALLMPISIGSYAAYLLTGKRHASLLGIAFAALAALLIVALLRPRIRGWLEQDACLDQGGAWVEREHRCRHGLPVGSECRRVNECGRNLYCNREEKPSRCRVDRGQRDSTTGHPKANEDPSSVR